MFSALFILFKKKKPTGKIAGGQKIAIKVPREVEKQPYEVRLKRQEQFTLE